jgi:serine/threonine protein kinase
MLVRLTLRSLRYLNYQLAMKEFDFKAEVQRIVDAGELHAEIASADTRLPREVRRKDVILTTKLGAGAFGEVWKAVLDESSHGGVPGYTCAVKTCHEQKGEGAQELLREATVMAQLGLHTNLVMMIGVVTKGTPLMIILALCEGSLQGILKEQYKKGTPLSGRKKFQYAHDVASGMNHLASRRFIHRDLAARNVLLDIQDTVRDDLVLGEGSNAIIFTFCTLFVRRTHSVVSRKYPNI